MMDNFIEQLKSRISLIELIGRDVKLTKRGRDAIGLCPFHREKSPSFNVMEDKQFYHCFGCGENGDALAWVMQRQNLNFKEAVSVLADEIGLPIPQTFFTNQQQQAQSQNLYQIMQFATEYYQQKLLSSKQAEKAREYLAHRNLDAALVKQFRLGFAPDYQGLAEMLDFFKARDVTSEQLQQVGLLALSEERDNQPYARFRDRLMFPITDMRGRVIAFGGRALQADAKAKYINSMETILFHKGQELYQQAEALQAVKKGHELIVAEGYMDVIRLVSKGFAGAVAPLGTALTDQQLIKLWRLHDTPILCFDGDNAGQSASIRVAMNALPLLTPNKTLRYCFLPEGHDPDSFLQQYGAVELQDYVQASLPLAEMLFHNELKKFTISNPDARAGLEHQLMQYATMIKDSIVSKHYRNFFKQALWEALRSNSRGNNNDVHRRAMAGATENLIAHRHNKGASSNVQEYFDALILLMLHFPQHYADYQELLAKHVALADAADLFAEVTEFFHMEQQRADISKQTMPLLFTLCAHKTLTEKFLRAIAGDAERAEQQIKHLLAQLDYVALNQELKDNRQFSPQQKEALRKQIEIAAQHVFVAVEDGFSQ